MSLAKVISSNDHHGRSYPILNSSSSIGKPQQFQTRVHTRTTATKAAASYTEMMLKEHVSYETNPLKMFDYSQHSSYEAISGRESGRNAK